MWRTGRGKTDIRSENTGYYPYPVSGPKTGSDVLKIRYSVPILFLAKLARKVAYPPSEWSWHIFGRQKRTHFFLKTGFTSGDCFLKSKDNQRAWLKYSVH